MTVAGGAKMGRCFLFIAAFAPAMMLLYLVLAFGVDIPFWDEWSADIAGLFVKAHTHNLSLGDFTALHNEHRIVIPRAIFLLVGMITGWNTIVLMILTWCCLFGFH